MTSLGIYHIAFIVQGRRNVSNIGWAQAYLDLRYWVSTTSYLQLIIQNIGWAHALVPPSTYGPEMKTKKT